MAKEETVLQGMIDKLIETGRYCGMEINVEKDKNNENFLSDDVDVDRTWGNIKENIKTSTKESLVYTN